MNTGFGFGKTLPDLKFNEVHIWVPTGPGSLSIFNETKTSSGTFMLPLLGEIFQETSISIKQIQTYPAKYIFKIIKYNSRVRTQKLC